MKISQSRTLCKKSAEEVDAAAEVEAAAAEFEVDAGVSQELAGILA